MRGQSDTTGPLRVAAAGGLTGMAVLAFVSLGLPDGVLGVAWPSLRDALGLGQAELGGLLASAMVGYLASASAGGTLVVRLGVGSLLALSSLVMMLSAIGYAAAPARPVALVAALLAGLGGGAIDAGLNTFAARRLSPRLVTWLHACYGVGAMLGPLLVTAVLASGGSWRAAYGLLAAGLAVLTLAFTTTRADWDGPGAGAPATAETAAAPLGQTLARPAVWLNLALFFLYTGLEVTAAQWSYTLFTEARGLEPRPAGLAVSAYWASLGVGRVVFGGLAARHRPDRLLRLSLIGAPAAALLLWWAPQPLVGLVGLAALGFTFAPIFPLLVAGTPARLGHRHVTHAVGLQVAVAYLGAAAVPGAAGALAAAVGLEVIPPFVVGGAVVLALLHEVGARRTLPRFLTGGTRAGIRRP
jgi:fucose permease